MKQSSFSTVDLPYLLFYCCEFLIVDLWFLFVCLPDDTLPVTPPAPPAVKLPELASCLVVVLANSVFVDFLADSLISFVSVEATFGVGTAAYSSVSSPPPPRKPIENDATSVNLALKSFC